MMMVWARVGVRCCAVLVRGDTNCCDHRHNILHPATMVTEGRDQAQHTGKFEDSSILYVHEFRILLYHITFYLKVK